MRLYAPNPEELLKHMQDGNETTLIENWEDYMGRINWNFEGS